MARLHLKHPLAIRWFHWIHFPLLAIMIISGLMIYWASSDDGFSTGVYRVGFGDTTLFHLFPADLYEILHLDRNLALGMAWHFTFMWLFALNGLAYVLYLALSGNWRRLAPRKADLRGSLLVILHDLRLRKSKPPALPYNPAQRLAYFLVILLGALALLTGLAIYRPVQLAWLAALCGGYQWARFEHFWITIAFLLFFLIHVLQVLAAGWNNFRSIVSGYEIVPDTAPPPQEPHDAP